MITFWKDSPSNPVPKSSIDMQGRHGLDLLEPGDDFEKLELVSSDLSLAVMIALASL